MRISLVVNALAALVLVAVALAGPPGRPAAGPPFDLVAASGGLRLSNSKAGQAIFTGEALAPGEEARGTVTIANVGDVRVAFAVEATLEAQTGARLWDALHLVATDATDPDAPVPVYEGPLAAMGRLTFAGLDPGGRRLYAFAVSLPRTTDAQDSLQGAGVSLRLDWSAAAIAAPQPDSETSTPGPGSQGSPNPVTVAPAPAATPAPVVPTATPTPAPQAAPAVRAQDVVSLPSAKVCVSRRRFRIRVRAPRGITVSRTTVYVNGRRAASKRAGRATIDLRGLPRGTVRVRVLTVLSDGRKLTVRRAYRTCTARAKRR